MKVFPKISILKTYKRKFTLGGKVFLNAGVKFNFKFCSTRLYFEVEYLALISRFYLFCQVHLYTEFDIGVLLDTKLYTLIQPFSIQTKYEHLI